LSISEAKYVAMFETVKEIRFVYYLLTSLGISVKLPIILRTDNIGAIFMTQNPSSGVRTIYIDTQYLIREHVDNDFINVVKGVDIHTKNVNKEAYEKHVVKFLGKC
jgi:hypothetical protein